MKEEVFEKLQGIFRDVFGDDTLSITRTTSTNDIEGWDSLTHISILEAVQDEFGIKYSLDEMIELNDVGKILDSIVQGEGYNKRLEIEDESDVWNASYGRGGNILFYPHEEIIRFINKYVRKRDNFDAFTDITPLLESNSFASLDLGCGIGRHIKFLDEFHLNPYGIDLSETAIDMGKSWLKAIGKGDLSDKMVVSSVTDIPFEDDFFSICVSHGVLDSMPRDIAVAGMKEVKRVLRKDALMYLDLIMDNNTREGDEIVEDGYEEGTIQSYFTIESIKKFLSDFDILDFTIITWNDEKGEVKNKRAHLVIKNTKS